jgi:hypothetical protein
MPKNRQARAGPRARSTSNSSNDFFAALVGAWWTLRGAKKCERRMTESLARMNATGEALWGREPGAPPPPPSRRQRTDDPLLKHVVLHGALLVLRPLLVVLAYGAVLWAMWEVFWWLI